MRRSFLVGFGSNITNPKVLVLYLSVLPQFLVPGVTTIADALLLALSVAVLGGVYGSAWSSPCTGRGASSPGAACAAPVTSSPAPR